MTKLKKLEERRLKMLFAAVLGKWFSRKMLQKMPKLSLDLLLSQSRTLKLKTQPSRLDFWQKNQLIHNSTTAHQSSVRLLVALASVMGFGLWTEDISQAYMKSASELFREVYLRPNPQLHIPAVCVLKLLRLLFGLADSGDYWHAKFSIHLTDDLGMKAVASDMLLFLRRARWKISSLLASYVYDTLACGENIFAELTKKIERNLKLKESKGRTWDILEST